MLKGAVTYSNPCKQVKKTASKIVIIKAVNVCFLDPISSAWWAQVTDAPELKSKIVFNKGISHGFKVIKKAGGQTLPMAGLGLKLEWKKAQKKAKKNITSDRIKNITPSLNHLAPFLYVDLLRFLLV